MYAPYFPKRNNILTCAKTFSSRAPSTTPPVPAALTQASAKCAVTLWLLLAAENKGISDCGIYFKNGRRASRKVHLTTREEIVRQLDLLRFHARRIFVWFP